MLQPPDWPRAPSPLLHTGDHGPFNSWDRQPYLTTNGVDDGFTKKERPPGTSILKAEDVITRNMIING